MKAIEVRIENYKSIRSDVKEFRLLLEPTVTVLVGANESGKTNVLEALEKFSTGKFDFEDIPYSSAAARALPEDQARVRMVSVVFSLEKGEQDLLAQIDASLGLLETITVTRDFSGDLFITDPDFDTAASRDELLATIAQEVEDLGNPFRLAMTAHNRNREAGTPSSRSASLRFDWLKYLIGDLGDNPDEAELKQVQTQLRRVNRALALLRPTARIDSRMDTDVRKPLASVGSRLDDLSRQVVQPLQPLLDLLPVFERVDAAPQLWLKGEYEVASIISDEDPLGELLGVRRLMAIAGLDLSTVRQLGSVMQIEQLDAASRRATAALKNVWHEETDVQLKLSWSPEGNQKILVMVNSDGHDGAPNARSYGFRWFLEFYLLYASEKFRDQPTVLMLEEPGIHLHPSVQEDLKRLIRDDVAKRNQVVYTTHLPGLYDHSRPEAARGIRKSDTRPTVTVVEDSYDADKQIVTWQVAMAALGIQHAEIMLHPSNLLVEGPTDWILLLTMAEILSAEKPELMGLATGLIHIRPCGGTVGLKSSVPLFIQPGVRSVVFVDHDEQGRGLKQHLEQRLGAPNENIVDLFTVEDIPAYGDTLSASDHDIEDLIGLDWYIELVNETLKSPGALKLGDFASEFRIGSQVEALVEGKLGRELRKDQVAWTFRRHVRAGDPVPDQTKDWFDQILVRVAQSF